MCGWAGRIPWGRECPVCHPKTDRDITYQVIRGRRDDEAIEIAKRYLASLEKQINADDLEREIELVLCASGYVKGEWTAYEVASVVTGAVIDWLNEREK